MPIDAKDIDEFIWIGYAIYNDLSDSYIGGGMDVPLYVGKDLSALDTLLGIYNITEKEEKLTVLNTIKAVDSILIKDASKKAQKRAKKMKSKRS